MQLPPSLPDELLFSRVVRFISIYGIRKEEFLLDICGSHQASFHPYFPPIVLNLMKLTNETADTLIFEQTMAPMFMRFLPQYAEKIKEYMLNGNTNLVVRTAQMNLFKEKQKLTLKYCPLCVAENIKTFGFPYWHRCHQIMGIESCYKHRIWLAHKIMPCNSKIGIGIPPITNQIRHDCDISFDFAKFTSKFLKKIILNNESIDYFPLLRSLGYLTEKDHIRKRYLTRDFYFFTQKIKYPYKTLFPESPKDFNYLEYLMKKNSSQTPFKHLLFCYWASKQKIKKDRVNIKELASKNEIEMKCLDLLKQGFNIAKVQRKTNKSQGYISRLALRNGLFKPSCSKKITDQIKKEIIELTYKGFDRKIIAKKFNISNITLEFIVLSVNGLAKWRQKCKYDSKRRRSKVQVIRYQQQNPNATRVHLKKYTKGAYVWLLKNEREWLEMNTPKPTPTYMNFNK